MRTQNKLNHRNSGWLCTYTVSSEYCLSGGKWVPQTFWLPIPPTSPLLSPLPNCSGDTACIPAMRKKNLCRPSSTNPAYKYSFITKLSYCKQLPQLQVKKLHSFDIISM